MSAPKSKPSAAASKRAAALHAEAEAWERLAAWCAMPMPERSYCHPRVYLCFRIQNAIFRADYKFLSADNTNPAHEELPKGFADTDTLVRMKRRLAAHCNDAIRNSLSPELPSVCTRAELERHREELRLNHPRVIFCLLMAEECRTEAK